MNGESDYYVLRPYEFNQHDIDYFLNANALHAIQTYSTAALTLFIGVFLILIVGFILFFVAFYPPAFGVGDGTKQYISKNTQLVVGTLAGLSVLAGVFVVARAARSFQQASGQLAQAKRDDALEFGKMYPMAESRLYPFPFRRSIMESMKPKREVRNTIDYTPVQ